MASTDRLIWKETGRNDDTGATWGAWVSNPDYLPPAAINAGDPNIGGAGATVNFVNLANPLAGPVFSLDQARPEAGYEQLDFVPAQALGGDNGGTDPYWKRTGKFFSWAQLRGRPGYGVVKLNGTWGEGSGSSIFSGINWSLALAPLLAGAAMGAFGELGGLSGATAAPGEIVGTSAGGALDGAATTFTAGGDMGVMDTLEASTGNFGDWLSYGTDGGMYNPQTGEYLLSDGTYNAGSTGALNSSGTANTASGLDDFYSPNANRIFGSGGLSTSVPGSSSVDDIFGKATKAVAAIGKALSGVQQATRNNVAPRTGLASMNLPLLLGLGFLAYKVL